MKKKYELFYIPPVVAVCYIFASAVQAGLKLSQTMMITICFGVLVLSCLTLLPYELWRNKQSKKNDVVK